MISALARPVIARLTRSRRGWVPLVGWTAFAVVAALAARAPRTTSGADHMMRGTVGAIVVPLLTYGIVSACLGGAGLRTSVRGVVALGARPARAALASVLVAMAVSAAVSALVSVVVCLIAHGRDDAPLAADLPATIGVTLLAGAAYASYFCAGSAIGRGAMRAAFLAFDWIIGAPGGFGAMFTPRGHLTSLLGGPTCFDLTRRTSSIMLALLAVAYLAMAVRLARRPS